VRAGVYTVLMGKLLESDRLKKRGGRTKTLGS